MVGKRRIVAVVLFFCAILPLLAQPDDEKWDPIKQISDLGREIISGLTGRNTDNDRVSVPDQEEPESFEDYPNPKHKPDPKPEPDQEPKDESETFGDYSDVKDKPKPEPRKKKKKKPAAGKPGLEVGFYKKSCPQAEEIVKEAVDKILERQVHVGPGIVRLFFHDCFVTGCDASILLEKNPNDEQVEKDAPVNGKFLKGLREIEEIKSNVEVACPGVVSCADIIAFATRDVLNQTGVPRYDVPGGRRDRRASLLKNADENIPLPETPALDIVAKFEQKGLTLEDLVVLIGAHSIGEAHCGIVTPRFYDDKKKEDLDPKYRDESMFLTMCGGEDQTVAFDQSSPNMMDSGFFKQVLEKRALLESDGNLAKLPSANAIMKRYAEDQEGWLKKFVQAIIKLGEIEVLTGEEGEIRTQCKFVN